MFTNVLSTFLAITLASAAATSPPKIVYPHTGTVWHAHEKHTIQWIVPVGSNFKGVKGTLRLGCKACAAGQLPQNLPAVASGFDIGTGGEVTITVPEVKTGHNWALALNELAVSETFTIDS